MLSWELPCSSQCETGHKAISRQGFVAGTSILAFGLVCRVLRVGHALAVEEEPLNAVPLLTQGSAGHVSERAPNPPAF